MVIETDFLSARLVRQSYWYGLYSILFAPFVMILYFLLGYPLPFWSVLAISLATMIWVGKESLAHWDDRLGDIPSSILSPRIGWYVLVITFYSLMAVLFVVMAFVDSVYLVLLSAFSLFEVYILFRSLLEHRKVSRGH